MYYYVFEQPQNRKIEKIQEKIRINLEDLGIIGEVTKANPVQKPEELAKTGLARGYHTIVAVGSDNVINNIAGLVAAKGATLGIIPTDPDSALFQLLGVRDIEHACEILPVRRVTTIDIGAIGEKRLFLTQITLQNLIKKGPKTSLAVLDFGNFQLTAKVQYILIQNGNLAYQKINEIRRTFRDGLLDIFFGEKEEKTGFLTKFLKPTQKPAKFTTQLHSARFQIQADPPMEVIIDDEPVDKTPVEFAVLPASLKIIVSKEVASQDEDTSTIV